MDDKGVFCGSGGGRDFIYFVYCLFLEFFNLKGQEI